MSIVTKSMLLQVIIEVNEDVVVKVDGEETRLHDLYSDSDQLFTDEHITAVIKDSLIDNTKQDDTIMWQVVDVQS